MHLFRATIFHTPADPFRPEPDDAGSLVSLVDGALAIEHGRIAAAGDFAALRREHPEALVHDWRGGVVVPGFVDAHVHFPQIRIIGGIGRTLFDWLHHVALPEEARMADEGYAAATAALFLRALASNGTTTALVFGAHYAAATEALFSVAERSGLRIATGLVVSDRRLRPDLHQTVPQAYEESSRLIRQFHGSNRLRYAVTPRFAYSTSDAMLDMCGQLLREHPGLLFQTHINESPAEVAQVLELFPWAGDYLAVYERYGLAGPLSIFAHNVHATDGEIRRMAAARSAVAHCPGSNAALGSGFFPLRRHLAAGVTCALGTDVGGGVNLSLLRESLQAYLLQRVAPDPAHLDAARLLYLATRAGALALGMDAEIGDFTIGKAADFVYLRPPPGSAADAAFRHAESPLQALSALVTTAGPESIRQVRVAGDIVYTAGQ